MRKHTLSLTLTAALLAARHVGVPFAKGLEALARFGNVKRRMEVRGTVRDITVYDDFAHHPTAIETTVAGLRRKVGNARILAVLEPRSNTMKLGTMKSQLPDSLHEVDAAFCVTDRTALGFLNTARHELGLAVPDEVAVIGFDGIAEAAWPSHGLTTLAQSVPDFVAAVLRILETPHDPASGGLSLEVPVELVLRASA